MLPSHVRRPVSLLPLTASVLALWFGLTAPDVSPVAPAASTSAPAPAVLDPGADLDGPRRDGRR